jgi:hypothetical protein
MQTPCSDKVGRSARVISWWIPAVILTSALWIGCGKSDGEGSSGDENSSALDTGTPQAVAHIETPGGEQAAPLEAKPQPKPPEPKLPLPANAKYLPKDNSIIISLKAGNMMKKGGYAELMKSPLLADLMAEIQDEFVLGLIQNPAAAGIDVEQPIHIFSSIQPPADELGDPRFTGGLVASVKDEAKIKALLDKLIMASELPLEPVAKKGYTAILPPFPAAIGYSKEALIIIISSNEEDTPLMPGLLDDRFTGKNALAKDSRAAAMLQRKYDLAAWADSGKLLNLVSGMAGDLAELGANPLAALSEKMNEGSEIIATVRFKAGSVEADLVSYYNQELIKGNLSKGGLDKNLLKFVPDNAVVAGSEAFSMKPFREFMIKEVLPPLKDGEFAEMVQQFENAIGLTIEDLLSIPKGDFLLVFDGLHQEDEFEPPMPRFLIGLSIDNKANLKKLLDNPGVAGGLAVPKAYGMELTHTDKGLFFYSDNYAEAVQNGKVKNPANARHLAMLSQNDVGGYLKFDGLVALIKQMAEDEPEAQMAAQIMGKLDELSLAGTFGDFSKQTVSGQLTFKDKKTNGLKQLVNLITELAPTAGINRPASPTVDAVPAEEIAPTKVEPIKRGDPPPAKRDDE